MQADSLLSETSEPQKNLQEGEKRDPTNKISLKQNVKPLFYELYGL